MAHTEVVEVPDADAFTVEAADATQNAGALSAADLGAALADEIGRLDKEGHKLQILASRMARDTRPEFEAWFEAGLLLRRTSGRLAEIAQKLV